MNTQKIEPKKVLIIKLSSLGDVIHTLPALTDAANNYPNIEFDWAIEEAFQEIPKLHPNVHQIFPLPIRRLKKRGLKSLFSLFFPSQWDPLKQIKQNHYDAIIDAQGLLKSALIGSVQNGPKSGLSWRSAREPLASLFYKNKIQVPWDLHAILRTRLLFAKALNYEFPNTNADFKIKISNPNYEFPNTKPYLVFLHGTTWATKHWPESNWISLSRLAAQAGYIVKLFWGNDLEKARSERIAKFGHAVEVMPKQSLTEIADYLQKSSGVITVDTGLGHLAAALNVPTVALYGPTDPAKCGVFGKNYTNLKVDNIKYKCSPCKQRKCKVTQNEQIAPPCFDSIPVEQVWQTLLETVCKA